MDGDHEDAPATKSPKTTMISVSVQELNGTKHTFELGAQWTVAEAKQRLAAHLSAHVGEPSHIKLIHAGRILKDTQTIGKPAALRFARYTYTWRSHSRLSHRAAEYNIQPDDLVVVMTNGGW